MMVVCKRKLGRGLGYMLKQYFSKIWVLCEFVYVVGKMVVAVDCIGLISFAVNMEITTNLLYPGIHKNNEKIDIDGGLLVI